MSKIELVVTKIIDLLTEHPEKWETFTAGDTSVVHTGNIRIERTKSLTKDTVSLVHLGNTIVLSPSHQAWLKSIIDSHTDRLPKTDDKLLDEIQDLLDMLE